MDTGMIIGLVAVILVILGIGGGFAYVFFLGLRPKKMIWKARIYQLGEGVISPEKDAKGNYITNYSLKDLKPYATDIIEKIDKKSGATHYWLQKLKKAVPVVTADCVEVWGDKDKWVKVLLEGDTTTLLKSGYDYSTGQQVFKPMPHDRINMIKTEIEERKARIQDTKDILTAITPFIVVGISMLALVAIAYFQVQGAIRTAEMYTDNSDKMREQLDNFMEILIESQGCFIEAQGAIAREDPPVIPS